MIDPNIKIASTPSGQFYCSSENYELAKEKIFAKTWQWIGDENMFKRNNYLYPVWLLEGCLNEPLILSKTKEGNAKLMSNVCTHRGYILITEPSKANVIRCKYHGRCFAADGKYISMPEFAEAENFPTRLDNLPQVNLEIWNNLYFASLFPEISFPNFFKEMEERVYWFAFDKLKFESSMSREYDINASWALYCDNYLEGFHIPFVHKSLNKVIDYGNYETHLFRYCNLQIGIAKEGELTFQLPPDSPDYGKNVASYYFWIFPNMMFNFYPWGLSINIVRPKGADKTTVSFLAYISDETKFNRGAGADLHGVEMEDEEVVESVQKGLRSRLYSGGRYSPRMEKGVHHFHLLMQEFLNK
jgi:choline monooxygenase